MSDSTSPSYLPICGLTTFVSRWVIKGRILDKSPKQPLRNGNSLFHIDIVDKQGDVIRAKFWGQAAEEWFSKIDKGKVYTFRGGRVLVANKRYSNIPHNYELTFDVNSEIRPADDDADIGTQRHYVFTNLRDVRDSTKELPFMVDLCVVLNTVGPCTKVALRKTVGEASRRTITVSDNSCLKFDITLWNAIAETDDLEDNVDKVLVLNDVQVRDWNGARQGQTTGSTELLFHYKGDEADKQGMWYCENGIKQFESMKSLDGLSGAPSSQSNFVESTIEDMIELNENNGDVDPNRLFVLNACRMRRLLFARSKDGQLKLYYLSCPKCKKKVVGEAVGGYSCQSCNITVDKPVARYMINAEIFDHSGSVPVRNFHEQGLLLMGIGADELNTLEIGNENEKIDQIISHDCLFKPMKMFVKAKRDVYNGEERIIYVTAKADAQPFASGAKELLSKIKKMIPNATEFYQSRKAKRESTSPMKFTDFPLRVADPVIEELISDGLPESKRPASNVQGQSRVASTDPLDQYNGGQETTKERCTMEEEGEPRADF